MRAAFYTLGCKVNQSETEALAYSLKKRGFQLCTIKESADIYIINTCTVTSKSEQKARKIIRFCKKRNNSALIIVTGCYAQVNPEALALLDNNILVIPQNKKDLLLFLLENLSFTDFSYLTIDDKKKTILSYLYQERKYLQNHFCFYSDQPVFHSRAYLKIQDGCDSVCTYCIVPIARGSSVSLSPAEVVNRVSHLQEKGYREIVLTGVNITSYYYNNDNFFTLLEKILPVLNNSRIRLSSLEPNKIDKDLTNILTNERICPHFHIPVQSGSDRILKTMQRCYTTDTLRKAVRLLKAARPESFLGADILVGYPGEEQQDFLLTKKLLLECEFSNLHVFKYSPRPDTIAYNKRNTHPEWKIKKRAKELLQISQELYKKYCLKWLGKNVEAVLVRNNDKLIEQKDTWEGLSANYLKLLIHDMPKDKAKWDQLVSCVIDKSGNPCVARFLSFL